MNNLQKYQNKQKELERVALQLLANGFNDFTQLQIIMEKIKIKHYPAQYQDFATGLYDLSEESFQDKLAILFVRNPEYNKFMMELITHDMYYNIYNLIEHYHDIRLSIAIDTELTNQLKKNLDNTDGLSSLHGLQNDLAKMLTDIEATVKQQQTFNEFINNAIARLEMEMKGGISKIYSKFFPSFNDRTGGLTGGNYIGIMGSFKGGKTSFIINLLIDYAIQMIPVAFFSLEMSEIQMQNKFISSFCDIAYGSISNPKDLTNQQLRNISELSTRNYPIYQVFNCYYENDIISKIRLLNKKYGVKVFAIDYLGNILASSKYQSKEVQISEISKMFRMLMVELDIIIFMLAQSNRTGIKNVPGYENMAESLALPRDCTYGFTIYNPLATGLKEVQLENETMPTTEDLFCLKMDVSRFTKFNIKPIPITMNMDSGKMRELYQQHEYIQESVI